MFVDGEADENAHLVPIDGADFDQFYLSTARRTLALARSVARSWSDAEDLVQDAYADAHRRWATVGALDDPAAWVRRAVLNRSASRWRRAGRELRAITRLAGRRSDSAMEGEPFDAVFWRCVAQLPKQQARVIALFYVEDRSVEQIAALLECSTGTIKTHLSRARATLHSALTPDQSSDESSVDTNEEADDARRR